MLIEQTPMQRICGLVNILAGCRDFELGRTNRGWDHAFVESEIAWFNEYLSSDKGKPSLTVASAFGESRIEISDGTQFVQLGITKDGIKQLIEELQTVLEMAD